MFKTSLISFLFLCCTYNTETTNIEPEMDDTLTLAYIIAGECMQCDSIERAMVGATVLNRLKNSKYPTTIHGVVSQDNQYKGYCTEWYVYDRDCYEIAKSLLLGLDRDTNILFFHSIRDKKPPYVKKILYRFKYHEFGI